VTLSFLKAFKSAVTIVVAVAALSGCGAIQVQVEDPALSAIAYNKAGASQAVALAFQDAREAEDKTKIVSGTLEAQLIYKDKPFDAVPWLADQTVKEMAARGLPVSLAASGTAGTNVIIRRIHIENHRSSGFSPFVTFTSLRADVETPQGPRRITAYVKRAKVPIWSLDEVIDPTFNAPLSILTKELAAKLNQQLFKQVVSDDQVQALIAKIHQEAASKESAYLDVYQLGFSNNPMAIPELVKLSTHDSEYVRLAALSSLGILKATNQIKFLIERYESAGIWQDRAMALKAIGDMDTEESRAYLQKQWLHFMGSDDKEARWTKEILSLYR
jgi:hypothetical protein